MTRFTRLAEGEMETREGDDHEVSFVVTPNVTVYQPDGTTAITNRLHIFFPKQVLATELDLEMYIDFDNFDKLLAIMQG